MLDLTKFFRVTDWRRSLRAPFLAGGKIIATNGRLLIAVPEGTEVNPGPMDTGAPEKEVRERSEACLRYLSEAHGEPGLVWEPFPALQSIPRAYIDPCEVCGATGKLDEEICLECDGVGGYPWMNQKWRHERTGYVFNVFSLRCVAELPSAEWALRAKWDNPHPFRFAGGIGLIMPMKS